MKAKSTASRNKRKFVICIRNDDYAVSLETRKIYEALPDAVAERHRQIRVIDESGEDYLYPRDFFIALNLPSAVQSALRRAA